MKKYLMMAVAALALCACSSNDEVYDETRSQVVDTYNAAFIKYVGGNIASNQTWGFGANATRGMFTRGTYPNANMWAASYVVPDPLTAEQKDIVRQYFQQNPNPDFTDPGWNEYFVQQVYKGGTNTTGSLSAEKYTSANNGLVVGSDHMDHLEAVFANGNRDHLFNFNFGECSWNYNVQDNNTEINDAKQHADQIQLMVNSTTNAFGYFNSDGSLGHTDYTGLVSWETIRTWANGKGLNGDCLNDGWNRSFMGFDFEQVIGDDIYAKDNAVWEDGKLKSYDVHYLTYGDLAGANYVWDGENATDRPAWNEQVLYNGKPVPMLVNETNQYCGVNGDIDQNQLITQHSVLKGYQYNQETQQNDIPYYQNENCLDMTVVNAKLAAGYLPVQNGSGAKWVKVQGGADGYYSDWIVTLTKANRVGSDDVIRIIAEDLSASDDTDFDFNDVVFDVKFLSDTEAEVTLLAAGGTIPLTVAGHDSHQAFGVTDVKTMINTNAGKILTEDLKKQGYKAADGLTAEPFRVTGINKANWGNDIKIMVQKEGEWYEITATTAGPAAKICVDPRFKWVDEKVSIKSFYQGFTGWVSDPSQLFY